MSFRPKITAEDVRANRAVWRPMTREDAIMALRFRPVVVLYPLNGFEEASWFDDQSPFFLASGPYDFASLRYFVFAGGGGAAAGGSSGSAGKSGKPKSTQSKGQQEEKEPEPELVDFDEEETTLVTAKDVTPKIPPKGGLPPKPERPEIPKGPERPEIPEIPDVPKVPELPERPEIPDLPKVPETPKVPEIPKVPEPPKIPGTPDLPVLPKDPRPAKSFYAVRVTDRAGKPLDGLDLVLEADGTSHSLKTKNGEARVEDVPEGKGKLRLADLAAARKLLAASAPTAASKSFAAGSPPAPAVAGAALLEANAEADPIEVPAGKRQEVTLVLPERRVDVVEVDDGMFRLDSAAILPEGERPDPASHEALTTTGIFAAALMNAEAKPEKKVLVAGHTDTSAGDAHNQTLSELRAECVLLCLRGGADSRLRFGDLVDGRHKIEDYKQVLDWVAAEFGFACKPPKINGNEFEGIEPIKGFQRDYNAGRQALGVPGADALTVDGSMGPKTWRAVFDCYEAALAREISSSDAIADQLADLARLRTRLKFLDDSARSLGFGEKHPLDQIGRDGFRSQTNRRVEILFFNPGEEPDLKAKPEDSEIYRPGVFVRVPIDPETSARLVELRLLDAAGEPIPGALCEITVGQGVRKETAGDKGTVEIFLPEGKDRISLSWRAPATPPEEAFKGEFFLSFDGDEGDQRRLQNLGFRSEEAPARIGQFRSEFRRKPEVPDTALVQEARTWHDGGKRPDAEGEAVAVLNFPEDSGDTAVA